MKIEIEIPDPPSGYTTPQRGPLWLPIRESLFVLIGENWVRGNQIISGGSYWIYTELKKERRNNEN